MRLTAEKEQEIQARAGLVESLYESCQTGNLQQVIDRLSQVPEALDGGDYDMMFHYPYYFGRSPPLSVCSRRTSSCGSISAGSGSQSCSA